MPEKGLGAGLGALFGENSLFHEHETVLILPITSVEPRDNQPRTKFDEEALAELAESLRQHGIIQPITVRRLDTGFYQIIAGERRWRAARIAGLTEVPVRVLEADERKATELALVENLQRENLNPIEEAMGFRTLIEDFDLSQEEVAATVGKSRPAVTNAMRLLGLSAPVLKMVEDGEISAGHGRALLGIRNADIQLSAAKEITGKNLNVRQAEALAGKISKEIDAPKAVEESNVKEIQVDYFAEAEKSLGFLLGRKVKIVDKKKKGRIELEYYGDNDLEYLLAALEEIGKNRSIKKLNAE